MQLRMGSACVFVVMVLALIAGCLFSGTVSADDIGSTWSPSRPLVRGSSGNDVLALQFFLLLDRKLTIDDLTGYFGAHTEGAVKAWQSEWGIVSSGSPATTGYGVVGPRTRSSFQTYTKSWHEVFSSQTTSQTGSPSRSFRPQQRHRGSPPDSVATYAVGGTLSGLISGETIVIENDGGDDLSLSASGSFSFSTQLTSGASYLATILTNPVGESCSISNGSGTVTSSVTDIAITCVDSQAPTIPSGITATSVSTSTVALSWTASTDNVGVDFYSVYRGGSVVGTTSSATYLDLGLTASTSYSYEVSATDAAGNSSSKSSSYSTTTSPFTYYVDSVTPGSDSNSGMASTEAWGSLAHADSVLSTNYQHVKVKYPDGTWHDIAPIWHGFLSYYPFIENTNASTTLYDVYNGHNGTLHGAVWMPYGLYFNSNDYASIPNFSNYGPTSTAAILISLTTYDNGGNGRTAFLTGNIAGAPRIALAAPWTDNVAYFDYADYTTGRVAWTFVDPDLSVGLHFGRSHTWGLLAGNNYQAIYFDSTREAYQNSNDINSAYSIDPAMYLGKINNGGTNYLYGSERAFMVSNNALSDNDYLTLENWMNNTEIPSINPSQTLTTVANTGLLSAPPMGWMSWRPYELNASEANVKANTDALVSKGLVSAGYTYVDMGDNWASSRNGSGDLVTNSTTYPDGMTALVSYIHSKGLKAATYLAPGTSGCNHFMGSQGFESRDAALIASWGVDYLMYDNCSAFASNDEARYNYQAMKQALANTGRSIIYLVSTPVNGSYNSIAWAQDAGGDMVWTYPDQGAKTWTALVNEIDGQYGNESYIHSGRWNLTDYLGAGNGVLTDTESESDMSLFAVLAQPLFISADLTSMSTTTINMLTNSEVIAVDQDSLGIGGKRVSRVSCGSANCEVYARQLSGGAWAVVYFNRDSAAHDIAATWSMFGQTGPFTGRNLWTHSNLGTLSTGYTAPSVPSHGVVMLKLTP